MPKFGRSFAARRWKAAGKPERMGSVGTSGSGHAGTPSFLSLTASSPGPIYYFTRVMTSSSTHGGVGGGGEGNDTCFLCRRLGRAAD